MASRTLYRWAPSTLIEPLVDSWPAWSYAVSPLTSALHAAGYQLPTLRAYLQDPVSHVAASRDPELFGGPWVDVPPERSRDVERLLNETMDRRAPALAFGRTFMDFQRWLTSAASGQSLEPLYAAIPAMLRGYLELVYDYCDRPSARVHEGLLYRSPYYDRGLQSLRLSTLVDDRRPFFMSTPRLLADGEIEWNVPFCDSRVDELMALDVRPQWVGRILNLLGLRGSDAGRVLPFLTAAGTDDREQSRANGLRLRYLGHACTLLEWRGTTILTDPFVPVHPAGGGAARLSFHDLPERIDFVLITHNHQDHFSLESLLRLRPRIGCLVVPKAHAVLYGDISLRLLARTLGFKHVVELEELESIDIEDGGITATPFHGEHGDLAHGKNGYLVRAGERRVWFAADSECLDPRIYENVREACGPADALFIGTESVGGPLSWVNGPLFPAKPDRPHHQGRRYHGCSASTALAMAEAIGAGRVYVYALGLEPWMDHLLGLGMNENAPQWIESQKLLAAAAANGCVAERLQGPRDIIIGPSARQRRLTPASVVVPAPFADVPEFQL